jgi:hypothetical protein
MDFRGKSTLFGWDSILDIISLYDIILYVNTKQKKTLKDVFHDPVKSSVLWSDVEGLFKAYGAHIEEGGGSKVCIMLNGVVAIFHRPHPQKETDKGALKAVRRFLKNAGVKNDEI